jgi:hypothetical protein
MKTSLLMQASALKQTLQERVDLLKAERKDAKSTVTLKSKEIKNEQKKVKRITEVAAKLGPQGLLALAGQLTAAAAVADPGAVAPPA